VRQRHTPPRSCKPIVKRSYYAAWGPLHVLHQNSSSDGASYVANSASRIADAECTFRGHRMIHL
jgi:hypothetical protein